MSPHEKRSLPSTSPFKLLAFALLALQMMSAQSQGQGQSEPYASPLIENPDKKTIGGWFDFEHYDSFSGTLNLRFKDIALPGNGDLPIELHRTYSWDEGDYRDPGFQAQKTLLQEGASDLRSLYCYFPNQRGFAINTCTVTPGSGPTNSQDPTAPRQEYNTDWMWKFTRRYSEFKISSGLTRPGGGWRFSVAPQIEVQSAAPPNKSALWPAGAAFPINRFSSLDYMYQGVCGISSTYQGVSVEFFVTLRLPDGSTSRMARYVSGTAGRLRSASNWELRCEASGPTRLVLMAPDGKKYELGKEVSASAVQESTQWMTTKATNTRTGAYFSITYESTNPKFTLPSRVDASDGRWLKLTYNYSFDAKPSVLSQSSFLSTGWSVPATVSHEVQPALTSAEYAGGAWTYIYRSFASLDAPIAPASIPIQNAKYTPPIKRPLLLAIPPTGGQWRFVEYLPQWNPDDVLHRTTLVAGDRRLVAVVTPTGGSVRYSFSYAPEIDLQRGFNDTPSTPAAVYCSDVAITAKSKPRYEPEAPAYSSYPGYLGFDAACGEVVSNFRNQYIEHARRLVASRPVRLSSRTTSDGGAWSFTYTPGSGTSYDITEIVDAQNGTREKFSHVGHDYANNRAWLFGALIEHEKYIRTEQATNGTSRLLFRKTSFEWGPLAYAPGTYTLRTKRWLTDTASLRPVLKRSVFDSEGVLTATTYGSFTDYGSPKVVEQIGIGPGAGGTASSTGQPLTRLRTISYYTDPALWLIDLPKDETVRLNESGTISAPKTPCEAEPVVCN